MKQVSGIGMKNETWNWIMFLPSIHGRTEYDVPRRAVRTLQE